MRVSGVDPAMVPPLDPCYAEVRQLAFPAFGGIATAESLATNCTRPHPRSTMPGRYDRVSRTPESTLTSKNRRHSSSSFSAV